MFNAHPKVKRTALVGVGLNPVLCLELEPGTAPSDELKKEILRLAGRPEFTKDVKDILFHPSFPVDTRHNAKINREALAIWAGRQLS